VKKRTKKKLNKTILVKVTTKVIRPIPAHHQRKNIKIEKKKEDKKKKHSKKTKTLPGNAPFLTKEDYYRHNQEFQLWLVEKHQTRFTDLPSKKHQIAYFKKFIKKWNSGGLEEKYYSIGTGTQSVPFCHRTSYRWNFTDILAEKDNNNEDFGPVPITPRREKPQGPAPIPETSETDQKEDERKNHRHELKKYRKQHNEVMEEIVPKPSTAHESRLDKSKMRSQKRQEKEDNEETVVEYDETNSFQVMLSRQQEWREKRSNERREKIQQKKKAEYRLKEDKTMAMLRELAAAKGYL